MTRQQIDDVALAARGAAIGQAVAGGNRCVFAIVVCGLDVGAPMSVQTNVVGAKDEDVIRILQNGIRAMQNNRTGRSGGGLIILSVLALVFGVLAGIVASGCGSVTSMEAIGDATTDTGAAGAGGVSAAGAAGGEGGAVPAGMAGGGNAGAAGAAGAAGGGAGGGEAAGASGMTGAGLDAGMTGGAGGGSCAPHATGAACYSCPAPAPTCPTAGRGRFLCCSQAGLPSCDLAWCAQ